MATAWISEYESMPSYVGDAQIAAEPPLTSQTVTFTTATSSSAFNAKTRFIQFKVSADGHYRVGGTAATTSHMPIRSTEGYFCAVQPGTTISFVTA